ncbi:hypothetical protein HYQ46_000466 [Verticillium longisporum]|nr:hypothetical protein HYQ46_000466 [Verticillium longisporum]
MTQTVFSEPCTVSAAASTTWTNVSDDGETLDSKADIEFNGLSLRSSIGECEPVTGSASLIDSAAATATATATVTAT